MKSDTFSDPQAVAALARRMGLPLPLECYAHWAKRSKIFEWCAEGLPKHEINGHACVFPEDFESFVVAKYRLQSPPARRSATDARIPGVCDLPLRLEAYAPWAGRSQLHAWKTEGLEVVTINGHACVQPETLGMFLRDKFRIRSEWERGSSHAAA